ncbi:MAG: penicillin-binding protein 2 [bacterium]|nr:penicillin-binding protein 2 [bacterium]
MSPVTRNIHKDSQQTNKKMNVFLYIILLITAVVVAKIASLQLFSFFAYDKIVNSKNTIKISDMSERGDILDRNGREIATSIKTFNLYVMKPAMNSASSVAEVVSSAGVLSYSDVLSRLNSRMSYIPISYDIPEQAAFQLKNKYPSIIVKEEKTRYYLNPHMYSNITGFVGIDNCGLEGIEYLYNDELKGKNGYVIYQKKPNGKIYKHPGYSDKPSVKGENIVLTIDKNFQEIAYSIVRDWCDKYKALKGSAIIMDVKTGEIYAMADYPTYNSNLHGKENPQLCKNTSVVNLFEPGSIFKLIPAVSAIEHKLIKPGEICKYEADTLRINGRKITDAHDLDVLSFEESFILSSNIGFVNIGEKIGKENLYNTAKKFGIGSKTGINVPGEQKGFFTNYDKWIPVHFANICFGQGLSVTAVQMLCAYNAIANRGVYVNPKLVKSVGSSSLFKNVEKRVVSEDVASKMNDLLVKVVYDGTGVKAKVNGVTVAGKTGTAEKASQKGGYMRGKYISSFIGYFPADDPKFIVMTIIDEPRGMYWASEIAAPMFDEIVTRIVNLPDYRHIMIDSKERAENEARKDNKRS